MAYYFTEHDTKKSIEIWKGRDLRRAEKEEHKRARGKLRSQSTLLEWLAVVVP